MPDQPLRLAVLIDAENARSDQLGAVMAEVARLGSPILKRAYADFSDPRMKGWAIALSEHAVQPVHQFNVSGKNSSDIALVIDAMDLLHSGGFGGFCLLSSDSDFTRLATRIRESGRAVYGFGEAKALRSFRQACTRFIECGSIQPDGPGQGANVPVLLQKLVELAMQDCGWVELAAVGQLLRREQPGFRPQQYGHATLLGLIKATEAFQHRRPNGAAGPVQVRLTNANSRSA